VTTPTDADLLRRYASDNDGAAFAALVRRHGPMVLATCRRTAAHHHDAEDAFQACFLVLAVRAAEVRRPHQLGGWLHGVALRCARKARDTRRRAVANTPLADAAVSPHITDPDLHELLDDALRALPDRYRAAVVLCHLEGRSRAEAARELGWSEGTLSGRLHRALDLLARRLSARGITAPGGALLLSPAVVPAALAESSCAAAALLVAGLSEPGDAAVSLADQVMRTMSAGKLKVAAAVLLGLIGVVSLAAVNWVHADPVGPPRAEARIAPQPAPAGTLLVKQQDFSRLSGNRVFTLTPDGKTETRFTPPVGLPDTFTPPFEVSRSPDGKMALVRGCDTRPRKKDAKDPPPFFPSVLCSFADGKGTTPVYGELEVVCWSPDGGTLVVREVPEDDASGAPVGRYQSIDLKTGERTSLPIPAGQWLHDRSPDGKFYLTSGKDPTGKVSGRRVFLLDRDGNMVRPLTDLSLVGGPARFGPDGTWVLLRGYPIAAKKVPGMPAWKLYRTPLANPKTELLTPVPDSALVGGFALSPDGKSVAFDLSPRVSVDLNPKKPLDADAETADEVEFALVVVGSDGKNPRTIRSVKTKKPFSMSLNVIDWR